MIKVEHVWNRQSPLEVAADGDAATAKIFTEAIYAATKPVTKSDFDAAILRVRVAYTGRKGDPTELKNAVIALKTMLNLLAAFVDPIALGDEAKIHKAGFQGTSDVRLSAPIPDEPNTPVIEVSKGLVKMSTNKVLHATKYWWIIFTGTVFDIEIQDYDRMVFPANGGFQIIEGHLHEKLAGYAAKQTIHIAVFAKSAAGFSVMSGVVEVDTA